MIERDEEFIKEIAAGASVSVEEVRTEWDVVASDDFIPTALASGQFDEERALTYIKSAVHSRFTSLEPAVEQNFVAIGFSSARKPQRGGDLYSELFCLFPDLDATPKIRRINVNGDIYVYKNVSWDPPTYFEDIRLTTFQDGGFGADRRAVFGEGTLTDPNDDYLTFVPKIKISEITKNLAKQKPGSKGTSWEDSTDWRAITGIVVLGSAKGGERPDGSEWGMFEINDNSLFSPINTDSKTVLTPALTCWCPRELVPTDESIITAFGPISKVKPAADGTRAGGYQMNVKRVEFLVRREVQE